MRVMTIGLFSLVLLACGQTTTTAAEETATQTTKAANWEIIPAESSVTFTASQQEKEFTGRFKDFTADIRLDPENLENAFIRAEIDMSSVEAGNSDRNSALPTRDWFHVKKFRSRRLKARTFSAPAMAPTARTGRSPFAISARMSPCLSSLRSLATRRQPAVSLPWSEPSTGSGRALTRTAHGSVPTSS